MIAMAPEAKENVLDGRGMLLVALVGVCALGIRPLVLAIGLAESWSWAAFGAVLTGGQNLVIVGRSGGFRRRPRAAGLFFVGALSAGALLGYWLHA